MAAQITKEVQNFQGLGSKIAALYADDQDFLDAVSDITLVVGYREYQLHKIILSASSPVFREMCSYGKPIKEKVPLEETEERAAVFGDFIKYLYTGNITLNLETVKGIIELADKYEVEDLKEIAEQFQKKHAPGKLQFLHSSCFLFLPFSIFYRPQGSHCWGMGWHYQIEGHRSLGYHQWQDHQIARSAQRKSWCHWRHARWHSSNMWRV